jgi:valyl-tRNA synthetase
MPFVTEECAQHLPAAPDTLDHRVWPRIEELHVAGDDGARREVAAVIDLVQRIRAVRQEHGVPATSGAPWRLVMSPGGGDAVARLLESLAPVRVVASHRDGAPLVLQAGDLRAEVFVEEAS